MPKMFDDTMRVREERLPNGCTVFMDDTCTFGADALLLAQFAQVKRGEQVCDLGTGCGILPLLWQGENAPKRVDGVECDPAAASLARRGVQENGLQDRIVIYETRWEELTLSAGRYDRVVSNPPYFAAGSGKISDHPARAMARHETGDTLNSVSSSAARLLKNGGHFVLCHRPERLVSVLQTLRVNGLEPKRLQFVCAKRDKAPFLLLCDAVKGGGESLQILPLRILEEESLWQEP